MMKAENDIYERNMTFTNKSNENKKIVKEELYVKIVYKDKNDAT
jgi:hypothetical protein